MTRSPWYALAGEADRVFARLKQKGASFIRLTADGKHVASNFDARGPHDVMRLASSGLEHHPNIQTLAVVGVIPNFKTDAQIITLVTFKAKPQEVNP
jgi:hypothetical protein